MRPNGLRRTPAMALQAKTRLSAVSSSQAASVAPPTASTTVTSSSDAVIAAVKRGPRGSMPAGSGWDTGPPGERVDVVAYRTEARYAADAGGGRAVGAQDQGGRRLQDGEACREVGAVREVDLHVPHSVVVTGDGGQMPRGRTATGAELGRELHERGAGAERRGVEAEVACGG